MNEKQFKKIGIIGCFLVLVFLLIFQSITDNITIRRANSAIDNLTRELTDAQRRLTDCRAEVRAGRETINDCRNAIRRVNNGLECDTARVSDIIDNLKQVRNEIEVMENSLNQFYDNYGSVGNDFDNTGSELVKQGGALE